MADRWMKAQVIGKLAGAPLVLVVISGTAWVSGCQQQPRSDDVHGRGSGGALATGDFRRTGGDAAPAAATPEPSAGGPAATPVRRPLVISETEARDGLRDVVVIAGDPRQAVQPEAKPSGQMVFVDGVVGQVNGRPIFAAEFLAPLDAQLRALVAQTPDARAWRSKAAEIIQQRLIQIVRDELFLAEARAGLSPEQKQGLIHFLTSIREGLASTAGGSEERAEERLVESEGVTLEAKAREERDKALIRALYQRQIMPRVNVSWRDVKRAYEKNYSEFNPPPLAVIRMVWTPVAKAGEPNLAAAEIQKLLDAGTPFETIAKSEWNSFVRDEGGLAPKRPIVGPYSQATIFSVPELNTKAQSLSVGQVTGPFDFQGRKVWMKLEALEQPPGKSLAEAQIEIQQALRNRKYNEEFGRYLQRLLDRGSFSDLGQMTERLLAVAAERYLPTATVGSPPSR